MNIWDESPMPSPDGEQPADAPPAPVPEANGAGSGGGDDEPPTEPDEQPEERWWSQRIAGIPAWLLLALGVVIWIAVIAALVLPGSDDDPEQAVVDRATATTAAPATAAPTTAAPATTAASAAATTAPPTDPTTTAPAPTTTVAPATTETATTTTGAETTTTTATTEPEATTTTTTEPESTTTTTEPETTTTTTAPAAPTQPVVTEGGTTVGDDGQSITVMPYQGPCSSGPECLVVGFTIDGWATHPMGWVCEFSSGARYHFRFTSGGADPACSTVDVPDSIVIEIDGLRTDPVAIG